MFVKIFFLPLGPPARTGQGPPQSVGIRKTTGAFRSSFPALATHSLFQIQLKQLRRRRGWHASDGASPSARNAEVLHLLPSLIPVFLSSSLRPSITRSPTLPAPTFTTFASATSCLPTLLPPSFKAPFPSPHPPYASLVLAPSLLLSLASASFPALPFSASFLCPSPDSPFTVTASPPTLAACISIPLSLYCRTSLNTQWRLSTLLGDDRGQSTTFIYIYLSIMPLSLSTCFPL